MALDGEEIAEQIQNASFMFPPDLWRNTSRLAIDLIQKLLKVEVVASFFYFLHVGCCRSNID